MVLTYFDPGQGMSLNFGQIDSRNDARDYKQHLLGAFCCSDDTVLGITLLDGYLQQIGDFADTEAAFMFSVVMFSINAFDSSALDWFYDGWEMNLTSSYDGINAGKRLLSGSWQPFTITANTTTTTTATSITVSDDTALSDPSNAPAAAAKAVAGIVTSLLLLVGAGLAAVVFRRRKRTTNAGHAKVFREVADAAKSQFARNYRHLRKQASTLDADSVEGMVCSPKSVSKMHQIGEGRRSVVYAGHMDVVGPVAIKELRTISVAEPALQLGGSNADKTAALHFLEEALLLRNLNHPNCIRVVGIVESPRPFTIVMQHCANGNLKLFLRACRPALASPRARLTTKNLTQTAAKVTAGMVYLSAKSIVHRALAAHSVMVGDTIDDIKLSRFGRSRDVYLSDEYVSTAPAALSNAVQHSEFVRWMSPEAIHDQAFSYASDVWSTAVVFYEIFTYGQSPPPPPTHTRQGITPRTLLGLLPRTVSSRGHILMHFYFRISLTCLQLIFR